MNHDYMHVVQRDCFDCGHDVRLMGEQYMVLDDLWVAACHAEPGYVHQLCVGCLEARLKMRLQPWCFTDAPLNWLPERWPQSLRLRSRLRETASDWSEG